MRDLRFRLLSMLLLAAGIGILIAAFIAGSEEASRNARPDRAASGPIRTVFPQPDDVALRQSAIGAQLEPGYDGRLLVDARPIPPDEVERIEGLNRISFTPGAGKEIEQLDEGRHCASVIYWQVERGEEDAGAPHTWCFTVS